MSHHGTALVWGMVLLVLLAFMNIDKRGALAATNDTLLLHNGFMGK